MRKHRTVHARLQNASSTHRAVHGTGEVKLADVGTQAAVGQVLRRQVVHGVAADVISIVFLLLGASLVSNSDESFTAM